MAQNPDVAIVTGGSRGIGAAVARDLASKGFSVALIFREQEDRARRVLDTLSTKGDQSHIALKADVTDRDQVRSVFADVVRRIGVPRVLVNNAGAIFDGSDWRVLSWDTWQRSLDVNLGSAFICSQEIVSIWGSAPPARASIVNIGSTYAEEAVPAIFSYSIAKSAIPALTRILARALAPAIRVNCVLPSNIDTDMTRSAPQDLLDQIVDQTPMKRLGSDEEVAHVIAFLVSEEAGYVTGSALTVDGGYLLR